MGTGEESAFFSALRRLGAIHGNHLSQRVSLRALSRGAGRAATTIGAWLDGSRFPQQIDSLVKVVEQLRAAAAAERFELAVCEAHLFDASWWRRQHEMVARHRAESVRIGVQRSQAEATLGEHQAGQVVGRPLSELDPFDLEVHHSIDYPSTGWLDDYASTYAHFEGVSAGAESEASLPALTRYIPRAHDERLRELVDRAKEGHSGIAMLVGSSSCGKTRACWEAVQMLGDDWRLWHPFDPTRPEAALADIQKVRPRTVVWLNEAQHYLMPSTGALGERVVAGMRALLQDQASRPVLILGTMWPEYWDTLTALPRVQSPDVHEQARKLLAGTNIPVASSFSPAELEAAQRDGFHDPRLFYAALRAADGQVTQYLAGGPSLLERFRNAPPVARAVLRAAIDARRMGNALAIPEPLLREAAPGYLTDQEWDQSSDDWFEEAIAYSARPCHGARGALTRIKPRPGQQASATAHYRLADYLEQHGRAAHSRTNPPGTLWEAALQYAKVEDLFAFARSARWNKNVDHLAFALKAARAGDHAAAWDAAEALNSSEDFEEALEMYQAAAANRAYVFARRKAAELLQRLGRFGEALAEYREAALQGHLPSVYTTVDILLERDQSQAADWIKQLVENTDLDILDLAIPLLQDMHEGAAIDIIGWLKDLADRGRPGALGRATDLMQQAGQIEEAVTWLRNLARRNYLGAELLLAEVLEEDGRIEEATQWYRQAAKSGYPSARSALRRLTPTSRVSG
ncbi:hypothetical protein [Streptomyces sp. NPDC096068]|uniref:hypothetical protein n=1 Tax=Streptomyces sp. NPDC096068 TaxID=3155424 RepID=UPI00332C8412